MKTYLPIDFVQELCTLNGMCAGNSRDEAVLKGISEIFERYVQYEIMMNNLTPPEIDKSYFNSAQVKQRLDEPKKENCTYRILDCSQGKGYPVIALELTYHNKYRIRTGSDHGSITALERCFTEIFKGYNSIMENLFSDIEDVKKARKAYKENDRSFWNDQYLKEITDGTGYYPDESIGKGLKPSCEFTGFEHSVSCSNEDDLNYYYDIIRRNGKKLYIADKSDRGFPAYYTVIPSLSEYIMRDEGSYFFVSFLWEN